MACSCMAKRRKKIGSAGRSTIERLAYVGLGALAASATNAALQNITDSTDESKLKGLAIGVGLAKAAIGGFMFMQKDQMINDIGLGIVAVGSLETAYAAAPKYFKPIGGVDFVAGYGPDGGIYQTIAGTDYLPLRPGKTLLNRPEETHGVFGGLGGGDLM